MEIALYSAVAVGASLAASLAFKPKSPRSQAQPWQNTLARMGDIIPWQCGRGRENYVFAWRGERKIHKSEKRGNEHYEAGVHVLGCRPGERLLKIKENGVAIMKEPLDAKTHPSGTQFTTLDGRSTGEVWWGYDGQPVNTWLADPTRLGVASRWERYMMIVWKRKFLGGTTTWNTIDYDWEARIPTAHRLSKSKYWLGVTGPGRGDNGVNPGHAMWMLLTAPWPDGLSIDPGLLADNGFEWVGKYAEQEHTPCSLRIEGGEKASQAIARLVFDFGIQLAQEGDKLRPIPQRMETDPVPTINADVIDNQTPEEEFDFGVTSPTQRTYSFRARDRSWSDNTATLTNHARADAAQHPSNETVELTTIKDSRTGFKVASRLDWGYRRSTKSQTFEAARDAILLLPGRAFDHPVFGRMRVVGITPGSKPATCQIEAAADPWQWEYPIVLPEDVDAGNPPDIQEVEADLYVGAFPAPEEISGSDQDHLMVLRVRAHQQISGAAVYYTQFGDSYVLIGRQDEYAAGGTLTTALNQGTSYTASGPDFTTFNDDILDVPDVSGAALEDGQLLAVFTDGTNREITSIKRVAAQGGSTWRVEGILRSRYGTIQHNWPAGSKVLILRRSEIRAIPNEFMTQGRTYYIKTRPETSSETIDLSKVAPVTFRMPGED